MSQERRWRLRFVVRERLGDLSGVLDEELCDGAERAVLHSDDAAWHGAHWHFDRQNLDLPVPGGETQAGRRENCEKAPSRQEPGPYLERNGDHSRARKIEPANAKGF